ncbi:MAG: hypothetical protein ACTSPT_09225, partial [Candidatus Heimdallarchaeota archaeon]
MKTGSRFKRFFYQKLMKPNILKLYKKELKVAKIPGAISSIEQSPERFEIPMGLIDIAEQGKPNNIMNRSTIRPMISNIKNISKSYDSLSKNTNEPKEEISENLLEKLKEFCKKQNIVNVGFTKLPHHLIFKEKAVLHDNAIVLVLEMDKDKIAKSPSQETVGMVMDTYNKLGIVANKVA